MNPHHYYLFIDLACIFFPLALSFDKKVAFASKWKAYFKANLITAAVFVVWDIIFTHHGVWGFNDAYISGIHIFNLPLEELLFFICIPYACTFLYETFKSWLPKQPLQKSGRYIASGTLLLFTVLLGIYTTHLYTMSATLSAIIILVILLRKRATYVGYLLFSYFVALIPFTIANGLLTGLDFRQYPIINTTPEAISDQIVWYANSENLGVRFFSIPFDDFIYGFTLIAMNIVLFEYYRSKDKLA